MSDRARELASRALVAAATVAVLLALVAGYARRAAFDSDQFANRASAALRDESVRSLVAERITDEVVLEAEGDLLAARPIIQSAASAIVGGRAFTSLFGAAVRDVHRTLFEGDANTLTLTVADAGTLLSVALQKLRPSLARDVESSGTVTLIRRDAGGSARARRASPSGSAGSRSSCWRWPSCSCRARLRHRPTGGAPWCSWGSAPRAPGPC